MKEKARKSKYSLKYSRRLQECKKIGGKAFTFGSDGKRVPFPMPLLSGVE